MEKERNKNLELLDQFFKNFPADKLKEIVEKIDKLSSEGPTIEEYLNYMDSPRPKMRKNG